MLRLVMFALVVCSTVVGTARAAGPLETSILAPEFAYGPNTDLFFDRAVSSGATNVLIDLDWAAIAPATPPPGFDATNPAEPSYSWQVFDRQVQQAADRGLSVFARLLTAPAWALAPAAEGARPTVPNVSALQDFSTAAARRFNGTFEGHPRVRYWGVWNEPNLSISFEPQFVNGEPLSPGWYRGAVNAVAAGVKSVAADNLVVAGGTAPFYDLTHEVVTVDPNWGPLSFMRRMLCLGVDLTPTCGESVRFDIWAHHPYTSGGPTRSAVKRDDVALGDLPEMLAVLRAAEEAGTIVSPTDVGFWVTEFSWDSNPPDPKGVPEPLLTRWVAEAMYRMWTNGVTLVTWFTMRDYPFESTLYQSGLYFRGESVESDSPKPLLQAFRFPFVAFAHRNRIAVWGRTPSGRQAGVVVEQSFPGGWKTLGTIPTDSNGIFEATYISGPDGEVRARTTDLGEQSPGFALTIVPDQVFHPFGGGVLEPIGPPVRPTLPQLGTYDSSRRVAAQGGSG